MTDHSMKSKPLDEWEFWYIISRLETAREGFLQAKMPESYDAVNATINKLVATHEEYKEKKNA